MFDKYLRIGLGLGSVSAISSIVYWSTQYDSYLPKFNIKPALTNTQKGRINSPSYQKILAAQKEVGCQFYLILDPKNPSKKAYHLLRETEVTDEMIEKLATSIDTDRDNLQDTNLSIQNMKNKCTQWRSHDKKLRVVMNKVPAQNGAEEKYQFEVKRNEQGGPLSYEEH